MRVTRAAAVAVVVPAVGAAILAGTHVAQAAQPAAVRTVVASSTTQGFRIDITAQRSGSGTAPSATVYAQAYVRRGDRWEPRGELRLGSRDGFFWNVLTGPDAVRDFTLSDAGSDHGDVQLLRTPALGWSPTYRFRVAGGILAR